MVGTGTDVLDAVLFHLPFEAGLAPPVRVLPAIVGEHLFGHTVLGNAAPVGLQHVGGRLAAIQPQGGNVAAVVVHEADQVGVATRQPEGHDVALPQLVGTGAFEEPGLGWILLPVCAWPCLPAPFRTAFCVRLLDSWESGKSV